LKNIENPGDRKSLISIAFALYVKTV